uniref:Uncharacterized protein n=1 Tax=Rhizophora mucronata TaxID=61149 RepID=A0A2P2N6P6_RHIMU
MVSGTKQKAPKKLLKSLESTSQYRKRYCCAC